MWRSQDARERPEAMQRVGLPPPAAGNLAASSEVAAAVEPPPAHTMRENHAPQPSAGSLGRKMCLQLQRSQPVVPHTAPLAAAACSLVQQPSAAAPAPSPSMFQSLFGDMLLQQPGPPEAGEPWLRLDRFQQHAAAGGPWEAPPGLMAAPARSAAAADGQPGWAEQQAAQEVEAEEASLAASCGRHFSFQQLRQQRRAPQPPPPSSTAAQQQREQPQKQAPVQPRQPRGLLGPPTTVLQQQQRQQPMLSLSLGPHQQALPAVPPADALQAAVATGLGTLPLAAHPATSPQPAAADGAAGGAVANAQPGHAPSESSGAAVPGSGGGEKAGSGGGAALATPAPLDLEAYLPADLAAAMQGACRMRQLFPWQAECLCLPGVMEQGGRGANLILQAPTGSGKSNVAYVLLLRALRQDGSRKGLLVLPFRQACEEQADRLAPIVAQLDGKLVKRSYGGAYDAALLGRQAGVVVCTPESANTLLNRLLDAGISPAREFSVAVVDEAHMAEEEEGGRGPAYERLLAKLRYAQLEAEERAAEEPGSRAEPEEQVAAGGSGAAAAPPPPERMQVVAMSATLARPHALARCLGARLFRTEYRPVQLDHFLVAGLPGQAGARAVKDAELRTLRVLEPLPPRNGRTDELCIGRLVQQEVEGGQQVLVFCATKKACKVEARRLAALLHIPEPPVQPAPPAPGAAVEAQAGGSTRSPASSPQQQRQGRAYFAARLQELGEQHALALAGLVQGGTAYHHSDVPRPARQLVQAAYQRGAVAALCTTTALKTSVNLPAGAAIFRQAYVSTREPAGWLTLQGYRQMSGRAGRVGLAAAGRSFLVHDPAAPPPLRHLEALLRAAAPSGSAAPGQDDADEPAHEAQTAGLRAALLEAVAGCRARTSADILRFLRCMLSASAAQDPQAVQEAARDALAWLGRPDGDKGLALILYDRELRRYLATPLGRAAFASALPVEEALALHADMKRLSRRLSLLCHLQLCFLSVSPHSTQQMRARHWLLLSQLLAREARDEEAEDALRTLGFAPGTAALAFAHRREREALAVAGSSNPHMPPLAPGPQGQPDRRHERLCSRLFTALALQELLREEPPGLVAARLELANLEELREQSIHFAGRAAAFAARRGWPLLAAVLRQFQLHLRHGCTLEVVPLLALGCVDTPTARLLHNAGLTTLEAVAEAGEEELVAALRHAPTPRGVPAERVEAKRRKLARKIKAAAAKTQADPLRGVLRGSADDGAALGSRTKRKRGGHGARVEAPTAKERQLVAVAHAHDSSSDSALAGGSNDESGGSMERHSGGGESMDEDGTEPASSEGGAGCASGQAAGEVCQQEQHRGQREPAPKLPELHCEPAMGRQQQQQPAEAAHLLPAGMAAEGASPPGPGSSSQLAALGLPSPGLHIVREEQDVLRLCRQLRASSTTCLGFALHVAPGSRVADLAVQQAVPPPPSHKRKREAAGAGGAPPPPGALLGLAVSWASGACAYVPLAGLSAGGSVAAELAALLCEGGTGGSQAATASAATPAQPSLGAAAPVPLRFLATTALQRQVPALRQLAPAHCRVFMPPSWVDARIAAWLLHPGASLLHALTSCSELAAARRLLRQLTGSDAAFESCADLAPVPAAQQGQQTLAAGWRDACAVAAASRAAWLLLLPRLGAGGGWALRVLVEQEMPLVAVLARMEAAGVGVHAACLAKLRSLLELRMGEAALQICQLAGRRVDMNRPADVSRLLYEELRLQPPPGAQPLKSGGYSCNKDAIKLLARRSPHPVLPLIQEWRKAGKTLEFVGQVQAALRAGTRAAGSAAAATEGDATAAAACLRQGRAGQGPRLWTALHQTNTDTGRLTMENPSLQCMPKAHTLQLQSGPQEASVRRALVAAPGCTLLSADYRQVELRILAHLSRDEALLRAFEDGRQDPFRLLAAQWSKHGLQPHQVSSQERTHTKHLTYGGLLYGMGSSRLGEEMGTSAGEAAQRRDEFLASFPGVAALLEQLREGCRAAGYVETLAGRRCPLPGIASPDWRTRGEAERKAVNTPMQGSAADLAKTAMLCIHERLAELGPGAAELLLMVHDELVLEVEQGRLEQAAALVRAAMEEEAPARLGITVPLRVRLSSGPSWGELRELQPGAAQDEHAAAGS